MTSVRALVVALSLTLLTGCESGTSRSIEVTIPDDLATSFSPTAPGLLVAELGGRVEVYLGLCGQRFEDPVFLSQDLGFGCLGESPATAAGVTETARVWVQPTAAGWDLTKLCAGTDKQREFYTPLGPPAGSDAGNVPVNTGPFAAAPEAGWAQASGSGTWERDRSPCGGHMQVELTLKR